MKRTLLFVFIICECLGILQAQNPADLAATPAVQETQNVQTDIIQFPEDALAKSMETSLSKKGKGLGVINSDGSIYVIGAATTARPSNMSGFINSRNVAYSIAEMTAKMNLLRMAGESISSGRGFQLLEDIIEGEDPDAKEKATLLQKAATLADKSMDKALSAMGVSDAEIKAMNESKKKAVYEQNYNQTILSLVAGMVKGCAVVRIAEGESGKDDYQVAVCMKYSPEFQSFASAIQGGGSGSIPSAATKQSRTEIMSMSEQELVKRLGVWVTYNGQGQMEVYGFGQQEVQETGSRASAAYSRAYSQARLQAVNNIKNFVAEDLVANESMQSTEKLREYADGTNAYFSRNKWEQAVKSKTTTLNIATEQVRQWKGVHPVSGKNVAGFVVAWTFENAQQAAKLRQQIDNNSGHIQQKSSSEGPRQQTTKGAITITGNDDDL
ncbi:MAG: hypothetical protein J6Y84_04310 [Bacteroidaceae bacterium]|nr:hypothetical protein [Bacteroidaceae bacterium]